MFLPRSQGPASEAVMALAGPVSIHAAGSHPQGNLGGVLAGAAGWLEGRREERKVGAWVGCVSAATLVFLLAMLI